MGFPEKKVKRVGVTTNLEPSVVQTKLLLSMSFHVHIFSRIYGDVRDTISVKFLLLNFFWKF